MDITCSRLTSFSLGNRCITFRKKRSSSIDRFSDSFLGPLFAFLDDAYLSLISLMSRVISGRFPIISFMKFWKSSKDSSALSFIRVLICFLATS